MRRVVVAGAGLLLIASMGVAHARTVSASSSHQWCAERSDVGVQSPSANLSFVLGIGIEREAATPNAFACWSNSANAGVVRAWASPETVRAGAECVPMPGSRTRLRCPRQLLHSPVDDDGNPLVDARHAVLDTKADTTSDAVDVAVSVGSACVATRQGSTCSPRGYDGHVHVDHQLRVTTGDEQCRVHPGRRCLVGGERRDPAVEARPSAHLDAEENRSAEQTNLTAPEISESE